MIFPLNAIEHVDRNVRYCVHNEHGKRFIPIGELRHLSLKNELYDPSTSCFLFAYWSQCTPGTYDEVVISLSNRYLRHDMYRGSDENSFVFTDTLMNFCPVSHHDSRIQGWVQLCLEELEMRELYFLKLYPMDFHFLLWMERTIPRVTHGRFPEKKMVNLSDLLDWKVIGSQPLVAYAEYFIQSAQTFDSELTFWSECQDYRIRFELFTFLSMYNEYGATATAFCSRYIHLDGESFPHMVITTYTMGSSLNSNTLNHPWNRTTEISYMAMTTAPGTGFFPQRIIGVFLTDSLENQKERRIIQRFFTNGYGPYSTPHVKSMNVLLTHIKEMLAHGREIQLEDRLMDTFDAHWLQQCVSFAFEPAKGRKQKLTRYVPPRQKSYIGKKMVSSFELASHEVQRRSKIVMYSI